MGYSESRTKPNLFYKVLRQGCLYADMRGTEEVPIWQDTRPLFYWRFSSETPMWERRRIIKIELSALFEAKCPCRLSFNVFDSEEFEDTSAGVDDEHGEYDWYDGYCQVCGKDFHAEGGFCSTNCETIYRDRLKVPCEVCGEKIELGKEVQHHVCYNPERIIYVHAACHQRIHKTDMYPQLKPSQEDLDTYHASKAVVAAKKQASFRPDAEGNFNCYRCKCRFSSLVDLKSHLATHKRKPKDV